MAEVEPARVEDPLALELPHVVAGHRRALDAENALLAVVDDRFVQVHKGLSSLVVYSPRNGAKSGGRFSLKAAIPSRASSLSVNIVKVV